MAAVVNFRIFTMKAMVCMKDADNKFCQHAPVGLAKDLVRQARNFVGVFTSQLSDNGVRFETAVSSSCVRETAKSAPFTPPYTPSLHTASAARTRPCCCPRASWSAVRQRRDGA